MNKLFIRGSVSLTLLYNKSLNKKIYLFGDNQTSCKQNPETILIADLFMEMIYNSKKIVDFFVESPIHLNRIENYRIIQILKT